MVATSGQGKGVRIYGAGPHHMAADLAMGFEGLTGAAKKWGKKGEKGLSHG